MDAQERSSVLAAGVAKYVAETRGRVAFQGADRAVIITGRPVNHILHLLLTILTGGLWLVVWVVVAGTGGERALDLSVAEDGQLSVDRGRSRNAGRVRWLRVGAAVAVLLGLVGLLAGVPWWASMVPIALGVLAFVLDVRRFGVASTERVLDRVPS